MGVKRAVPISALELQSRVEHADAMTSSAQRLMSLACRKPLLQVRLWTLRRHRWTGRRRRLHAPRLLGLVNRLGR